MALILAIDQSTSATKAVMFDSMGHFIDAESREHQQFYPCPGWVEHDAEEIWRNTLSVTAAVISRQNSQSLNVACVSITNQRETIVVFEKGSGRPLHRAIVWQCRRGDALCAQQVAAGRDKIIRQRTGLRINSYFSGSKWQWLMCERPELAHAIRSGRALVGTMDTYLIYRLTNGEVFATDQTNASRTLFFDISQLRWSAQLCDWWQVPIDGLAEVRESAAVFGTTSLKGQLQQSVPICGVMGDSQAALFGHGCVDAGMAKVTFGTGSSIMLNAGNALPHCTGNSVVSLAWVHDGVPTYALEGLIISSAATINWLRDRLGLIRHASEVEALVTEAGESSTVYFVPAFSGLGAPHWRDDVRGAIVGLTGQSDRAQVVRAAFESIAYQLREVLDMLRGESGLPVLALHADGGPTESRLLMQFTADIAQSTLQVQSHPYGSSLGVACMGALGLGLHRSMDDVRGLPRNNTNYIPNMPAPKAHARYSGWLDAIRHVLYQS